MKNLTGTAWAFVTLGIVFMIIGATFTTRHDQPEDDEISAP